MAWFAERDICHLRGARIGNRAGDRDILKVLTTVVHILKDYTAEYPQIEIFFTGSTDERTRLYTRIIKRYFSIFNKEFRITGLVGSDEDSAEVLFDPKFELEYFAFLIKRIN